MKPNAPKDSVAPKAPQQPNITVSFSCAQQLKAFIDKSDKKSIFFTGLGLPFTIPKWVEAAGAKFFFRHQPDSIHPYSFYSKSSQ